MENLLWFFTTEYSLMIPQLASDSKRFPVEPLTILKNHWRTFFSESVGGVLERTLSRWQQFSTHLELYCFFIRVAQGTKSKCVLKKTSRGYKTLIIVKKYLHSKQTLLHTPPMHHERYFRLYTARFCWPQL